MDHALREISRRAFTALAVPLAAKTATHAIGVMCNLPAQETGARRVLDAARDAGFRTVQVNFPWDHTEESFIRALPRWVRAAGVTVRVLSAYVNCASPDTVIMNTRASDFDRAIDLAPALGADCIIAWTGGHGSTLMSSDPRNTAPESADAVCRFLQPRLRRLESARLTLGLETYITLVCPDAASMKSLLGRLPPCVTAVMDPPNMTPVARYSDRDIVLRDMFALLAGRIGVVHLKDFRLKADGSGYELPGPLEGEMNYPLYASLAERLPASAPFIAEHLSPREFRSARERLAALFG